jgi:hypothetical protein
MKKITFTLFLMICFNLVKAQVDRDFWFAIPKETDAQLWCTLNSNYGASFRIAAMDLDANVVISMPANQNFAPIRIVVPANTSVNVPLINSMDPVIAWTQFDSVYANPAHFDVATSIGITNHGIHITSDNDITVYYDYNNFWNSELFSLKGSNALGTSFYTPFQNIWPNDNRLTGPSVAGLLSCYNYRGTATKNIDAYSEFDIVASEDNTTVEIYDATGILVTTVDLKAGQTYTYTNTPLSKLPSARPVGFHITSNHPIAITINDDSVVPTGTSSSDVIGDQIVPTNVLGTRYLIQCGDDAVTSTTTAVQNILRGEQVFVVATQPGTTVSFKDTSGNDLATKNLNAGQSTYISPDITKGAQSSIYIESTADKPIYVLHVSGHGGEVGGAILPPATGCTGSNEVTIVPTLTGYGANGSDSKVTIELMVPYNPNFPFNDSTDQAHYHFTLSNSKGSFHIPGSWFELNKLAGWAVLKMKYRNWGLAGTNAQNIVTFNSANKITNTAGYFHLGMMNGSLGGTNKYGYFSSFGPVQANVRIAATKTTDYIGCFGSEPVLAASGGNSYLWHYGIIGGPPTYIANPTSATTSVIGLPAGSHDFYCDVTNNQCFGTSVMKATIVILPKVVASFSVDKSIICPGTAVQIINNSSNAQHYTWSRKIDNTVYQTFVPDNNLSFTQILSNSTNSSQKVSYRLLAYDNQGCNDTISRTVSVLSSANAMQPIVKINGTETDNFIGCFGQTANLEASGGTSYRWHYDSPTGAPLYVSDPSSATPSVLNLPVGAHNFYVDISNASCSVTLKLTITIIKVTIASFNIDQSQVCSGRVVQFTNNSQNADMYKWTKQVDNGAKVNFVPANNINFVDSLTNLSASPQVIKYNLLANNNSGCSDTISHIVSVFPKVSAQFTASTDNGNSPLNVTFTNQSINANVYSWNFGDGMISSEMNPVHIFNYNGAKDTSFQVNLNATSGNCYEIATKTIKVSKLQSGFRDLQNEAVVKVYPNPAKDVVNIEYSLNKASNIQIELLEPSGKSLNKITDYQMAGSNVSVINIDKYPANLFILRVIINQKTFEYKVIKN